MKIYIAGPMRGRPYFNFAAFDAARDMLIDEGLEVVSPADLDRARGFDPATLPRDTDWNDMKNVPFTIRDCFDQDLEAVTNCDAIYMLKGWQTSTGAQAEYWCARWLQKKILFEYESICEEAHRIQGGDRQQDYGHPRKNFQDIADLWNALLGLTPELKARDVAHMMILMKVARNAHKPKHDNAVDIAGYAQCLGKIDDK